MKKALITGINGMDGSHLADLLLKKGYEVYGMERRTSSPNRTNTKHLEGKIRFVNGDLTDQNSLVRCLKESNPNEVYNLGAMSFVGESWNTPEQTSDVTGLGVLRMLEAIREYDKSIKFYQASSSEMFGGAEKVVLNEESLFEPKSPYAAGKVFAHNITKVYRESYGIFAVNGILFNHESPHRGETFVTRKITRAVGRIYHNLQTNLTLGNLDASRDWGFAGDYTEGMYAMMQNDSPDDWVLATGETHSVKEFAEKAFNHVGLNWKDFVLTSEKYSRPNEVHHLLGDASKAKSILGWEPKTSFNELVKKMVDNDLDLANKEKVLIDNNLMTPTWEYAT